MVTINVSEDGLSPKKRKQIEMVESIEIVVKELIKELDDGSNSEKFLERAFMDYKILFMIIKRAVKGYS